MVLTGSLIKALWNLQRDYMKHKKLNNTEVIAWGVIMIQSGGITRYTKRADDHAERIYERSRRSKDFLNVAKNTSLSIE